MAIYNEILNARYAKALVKLLGMKGGNPAKQLSGEIMAVLPMFYGVEHRAPEGWNRFAATMSVPAVAAQTSGAQIRNPPLSGVIVILESVVTLISSGEVDWTLAATTADMANQFFGFRLDARQSSQSSSAFLTFGNNFANLANIIKKRFTTVETENITYENQEITLLPGDALRWLEPTVNLAFNIQLVWRERGLDSSELVT